MAPSKNEFIPRIGVGVYVKKEGKVLLGKRKNAHGAGEWSCPGGHLEFKESIEECALRELKEETGLQALSCRVGPWTNNLIDGHLHYITFFVYVDEFEGEVQLLEPHKCEGWQWFDEVSLPSPLFAPIQEVAKITSSRPPILKEFLQFVKEREWAPFHSPKNLAMNLASEVGELVDPFRWLTEEESYHPSEKAMENIRDEIGDVYLSLIYLAHQLGIDPIEAAHQKIKKTAKKYPVEIAKGKAEKHTTYEEVHYKDKDKQQ